MSIGSNLVVFYDLAGNPLPVQPNTAIPASTSGLMVMGSDGTNSQYLGVARAGGLKTSLIDSQTATGASIGLFGGLSVSERFRLSGGNFFGVAIDTAEWTPTLTGSGSVTVASGYALIATGATANSTAQLRGAYNSTFLPAQSNMYITALVFGDTGTTNCLRRWGAYNTTDGIYFQLNGTAFALGTRIGSVDTLITSFSGTAPTIDTNYHAWSVEYSIRRINWYQDGILIHSLSIITAPLVSSLTLPITMEVDNSSNLASNKTMASAGSAIYRIGQMNTVAVAASINDSTVTGLVKAVITGKSQSSGNYVNAAVDDSGRLVVVSAGDAAANGFAYGTVATSAITNVVVRATTYTEQAANATRSLSSSSANDASAGTGARTVKVTYYDSTGAGPSTETVTLNGTTAVAMVSSTVCYIEKIEVMTVGSNGSNVGTITLFVNNAGGGGTIGTIAVGDNRTFWAHHYVPTGKTCYITGMTGNNNNGSNQTLFSIKSKDLSVAAAPEIQISDTVVNGGGVAQSERAFGTPLKVAGPSRISLWAAPGGTPAITNRGSFDFYDQ